MACFFCYNVLQYYIICFIGKIRFPFCGAVPQGSEGRCEKIFNRS